MFRYFERIRKMVREMNVERAIIEFCKESKKIPNLVGVILFGSALEGKLTKKSDIDLALVFSCRHNPEVGREMKIAQRIASKIEEKYKLENPFSFIFLNIKKKEVQPSFLFEISKGLFFSPYPEKAFSDYLKKSLSPYLLVKYSTRNLVEKDKKKVLRNVKKIVEKNSKIGKGVILIKKEKFRELKKLLDNVKADYRVKEVWV